VEITITLPEHADRARVFGASDRHLKLISEGLGVRVAARNGDVRVLGEPRGVLAARRAVQRFAESTSREALPTKREALELITAALAWAEGLDEETIEALLDPTAIGQVQIDASSPRLDVFAAGKRIAPRSPNQRWYLDAIENNDLVLAIGPAGAGKTYLAVAAAAHQLRIGRVRKVILARPAVEAGEKLGFLPGDIEAKVNPYLRPLFDALHDMLDYATIKRFILNDVVEIVPLAFMRGRTLNDAVIILDEAQNTTRSQMQMFLTRMGERSKAIVTGDITQIDLADPTQSGLIDACRRLKRVPGVEIVTLDRQDIVRHALVQRIVEAYGETQQSSIAGSGGGA